MARQLAVLGSVGAVGSAYRVRSIPVPGAREVGGVVVEEAS